MVVKDVQSGIHKTFELSLLRDFFSYHSQLIFGLSIYTIKQNCHEFRFVVTKN